MGTHETMPPEQRYPLESSYDLIVHSGEKYKQLSALEFIPTGAKDEDSRSLSFTQLAERVHQTANLLFSNGVNRQDTVTLLLPGLPETHFALWGSQAAGVASPINPMLDVEQIVDIMNATQSRALITLGPDYDTDLWNKVEQIIEQVQSLETLLLLSNEAHPKVKAPARITVANFSIALAQQPSDHLVSNRNIDGNDMAAYFHTGGTTGRPKVAKLTHHNIAFVSQAYADITSSQGQFSVLCGLPLFHIYGVIVAGIASLFSGRTLVMLTAQGFRSKGAIANAWHHIERFQIKSFAVVPTILNSLMQIPVGNSNISCLQEITTGAAPLSDNLKLAFEEKFNVCVNNGYGMTESTCLLARSRPGFPPPLGSVGIPLPYMEMLIAEVDKTRLVKTCKPGMVGDILARGPHIFAGYLNPVDNAKAWVDNNWFNTGDRGYVDEGGNLFLTGRSKDLIIRGGHNIDPALIEDSLAKHPAVADAVAIGQPDTYAGEIPVAYVTLKPGLSVTVGELLEHCKCTISERAAIPKRIEVIELIPLTTVGKVFKPTLRNRATEFAIEAILSKLDIDVRVTAELDAKRGQIAKVQCCASIQKTQALAALDKFPVLIEIS